MTTAPSSSTPDETPEHPFLADRAAHGFDHGAAAGQQAQHQQQRGEGLHVVAAGDRTLERVLALRHRLLARGELFLAGARGCLRLGLFVCYLLRGVDLGERAARLDGTQRLDIGLSQEAGDLAVGDGEAIFRVIAVRDGDRSC